MGEKLPTGTVTFLFSDVEGSTQLWEQHHDEMRTTLAAHDEVMRSSISDNGGQVFSTAGDAYSAAFERPANAIQAAIEAQRGLDSLSVSGTTMKVRMAVHSGSADERDGDYFGPAVNRVARLMSVGNGGQVLVSTTAAELVQDTLPAGATLQDLGQHRLKDLSRPERVYQLFHESIPSDSRSLRSLDAFPHNLPIQLTSFVGREEGVEELAKLLGGSRMITLAGVGGAGKTRLAIQAAAELLTNYEDGVWLVELAAVTDPTRIPGTVMDILGVDEKVDEDPIDTVAHALSRRRILLILDNCEHIVDPAARFAATALGAGPGISILATSREMLGVPGEYPFQVRSLASPDSLDSEVRSALLRYPAVRLFSERGELARPGWRVSTENAASVVQICRRLDGMPLAIELAAARLRMMRTEQIAGRLDDRFRLLTGGSRTALPRQQTLEAAIDWSFELLSDDEKTLFGRLAVFMGGFTLEAAEAVCGVDPLDAYSVLEHLGHLVDKSLTQAEEMEDGLRYRMLETLRQYARQRLAESKEGEAIRRRHAEHFRTLVEEAEPNLRGEHEAFWFGRLDDELDNIRQAMSWAFEAGEARLAQALSGALYRYFMYRFRGVEGREWAEKAVEASSKSTSERARALLAAGTLAQFSYDDETSARYLDEALEIARNLGLDDDYGAMLNNRANVHLNRGEYAEAERLYREHLLTSRDRGEADGVIISHQNLAATMINVGEYDEAVEWAEAGLREAESLRSGRMIFHSRIYVLYAAWARENLTRMEEVLAEMDDEDDLDIAPGVLSQYRGIVALERGNYEETVDQYMEALRRFRGLPDPHEMIAVVDWLLWSGGQLLGQLGMPEPAAQLIGASHGVITEKNFVRAPFVDDRVEAAASEIREALGAPAYESAYGVGAGLDPGDAFDLLHSALTEHRQASD